MTVTDVFHLQSGYTVFAGPIQGSDQIVRSCKAELFIDGKLCQRVEISGEFLMNVKHPEGYRAISTEQHLDLTSTFVKQHFCQLKEIWPSNPNK
ncbi:MAG: hypothetical protein GDA44_12175 [Prochloron sp. SP5CPC1]|nr:hypothetical protein [Candidatus Paraprochloron terpiosi SP5CPC1]